MEIESVNGRVLHQRVGLFINKIIWLGWKRTGIE